MAEIFVWSTADLDFDFIDESGQPVADIFDGAQDVVLTIAQGNAKIEKHLADMAVSEGVLKAHLAQQDTARLTGGTREKPKRAFVQVNISYGEPHRDVTYEEQINVYRNLHPRRLP